MPRKTNAPGAASVCTKSALCKRVVSDKALVALVAFVFKLSIHQIHGQALQKLYNRKKGTSHMSKDDACFAVCTCEYSEASCLHVQKAAEAYY